MHLLKNVSDLTDLDVRLKAQVEISNVGLKMVGGLKGLPEADFYIDARGLPDGVGRNKGDISAQSNLEWVKSQIDLGSYTQIALDAIHRIGSRRRERANPLAEPFKIVVFCAYGMHRSPALRDLLVMSLRELGYNAKVINLGKSAFSFDN